MFFGRRMQPVKKFVSCKVNDQYKADDREWKIGQRRKFGQSIPGFAPIGLNDAEHRRKHDAGLADAKQEQKRDREQRKIRPSVCTRHSHNQGGDAHKKYRDQHI